MSPIENDRGFKDTSSRIEVDCRKFQNDGTAVIVTAGQSTADNAGNIPYKPHNNVFNLNPFNGKCYRAEDPLLGTTASGGSTWSRLGDRLTASGAFENVLFVPIAVGGSSVKDWIGWDGTYHGRHNRRFTLALDSIKKAGLKLTHILWQQGETDAVKRMKKENYIKYFGKIVDSLRSKGVSAPIFIARASYCQYRSNKMIRDAQFEIPTKFGNVFHGPDSDQFSNAIMRYDGCHMSGAGQDALADSWRDVLIERK